MIFQVEDDATLVTCTMMRRYLNLIEDYQGTVFQQALYAFVAANSKESSTHHIGLLMRQEFAFKVHQ